MKDAAQALGSLRHMMQQNTITHSGPANGHYQIEVQEDQPPPRNQPLFEGKKEKKVKKSTVVEVQAHVTMEEPPEHSHEPTHTTATLGVHDNESQLPQPIVTASNTGADSVRVTWHFKRSAEPLYRLMSNVVNIVGPKFTTNMKSDISFDCLQEHPDGSTSPGVQHQWTLTHGNSLDIQGLAPGMDYQIQVVASYALSNAQQPYDIQAKSDPITYTTMGPPKASVLRGVATDMYQVTLGWEPGQAHRDVKVKGYRILVDGRQMSKDLDSNVTQTVIDNLQLGKVIKVCVQTLAGRAVGDSELSNTLRVACPAKPPPPAISQQPSYKQGTVLVAWERPHGFQHASYGEDISFYRIYLDAKWHGEVKACAHCNRNGYQYLLSDLSPGQSYDVTVKAFAGQRKCDPTSESVYCLCESDMSNGLAVMCPAPPTSPVLRLEGMDAQGIDVTWTIPQQYGDAQVSGYQMMKNNKMYGSIIPADVHSLRIHDLSLGEKVELQILALTDHPVGRDSKKAKDDKPDHDSEIPSEIYVGDKYSACKPGPKLTVIYTGLVQAPVKVWCEQVTGHSAMIVWQTERKPKPHYVQADSYQVTWWPGEKPEQDINSQQTKEDHLLITGLKPHLKYSVVVEARKMQKYKDSDSSATTSDATGSYSNTFILTAQTERISLKTASPPNAPSNLGIVATTCNSIQVGWDPPKERGAEVIGMRIDAVPMKKSSERAKHQCVEVVPDASTAVVSGLCERTEYLVTVTAVTEEYFDQLPPGHDQRKARQLPKSRAPPEDTWLPSTSIMGSTSGTIPPTNLRVVKTTVNQVTLTWKPAQVFGTNRLQGHVVRWAEGKFTKSSSSNKDETQLAHHKSVQAESNKITLEGLHPGILYKMVVEAVVSVKTTLESKGRDPEFEKLNRRTTHVMSKPVFVRTRAPCERPKLYVTGYTQNTIMLYWERPKLYSVIGKDSSGNPQYLKLSLENYRLEINGKPHMRLLSSAQSCTLIKCKAGKKYKIELVACTCTEEVKKERKRRGKNISKLDQSLSESLSSSANKEWEITAEDLENDESRSKHIEVTLPRTHEGLLKEAQATYVPAVESLKNKKNSDKDSEAMDLGDIKLDWAIQGDPANVRQFKLEWRCHGDDSVQTKVVSSDVRSCCVPVQHRRCLYDMSVKIDYSKEVLVEDTQLVQCLVPGSPSAPEIWTRSVGNSEFVIEWGEPRLYGVKVRGYQVYMNGKKVGNALHAHHRKAVIPCKPRRQYKVTLVALSADSAYRDSSESNMLLVHTGDSAAIEASSVHVTDQIADHIRVYEGDGDDLPVKVVKVTESTIHLDWSNYTEIEGMTHYKVVWSSVAQPAEREVRLPAGEHSCVIHKCYPGTNHFARLYACGDDERILDKSAQIQAQTSAAPNTPNVSVRACNFKYVAIQWDEPTMYGDAQITGYKVFVNGVVEAVLGPDQHTYSYTHGKWCKEYIFQVQALTNNDDLNSKPSEPLVVTWPGVQAPVLKTAPSVSGNCMRITWYTPESTEGVKIKQYKLVCLDEDTERVVQIISPIHPDAQEAELQNLKHGHYLVYVEVHVHGTTDVVKSDVLRITPSVLPDPPHISVTVIGLEERRQIESVTCDLINKRDKLISVISNTKEGRGLSPKRNGGTNNNDTELMLNKAAESLAQVEEKLDDCLSSLNHYTGHLLAHVSWTCAQSNPEVRVAGYKVLVDGKQYGTTLHAGVKNVRIKLGLGQPSHRLSMVSVCERPQAASVQSNVVELLTEPFLPFTFYSFLSQDPKSNTSAGPSYQEALAIERKKMGKKPLSQGLIKRRVPPPACTLLDIHEGAYYPLFPPSGPRSPTAVLFWAKWCYSSRKTLEWFVKYAKNHSSQFEFIAIACTPPNMGPSDRQDLVQCIQQNGWREDSHIRHVTSQSANEIVLKPYDNCKWNHHPWIPSAIEWDDSGPDPIMNIEMSRHEAEEQEIRSTDVSEIFGVQGVPTMIIVHPEDYIAWKGRYCAFDYDHFEHFMNYVFAQSMQKPILPDPDPWEPQASENGLDTGKSSRFGSSLAIHRPMSGTLHRQGSGQHSMTIHMNGGSARPVSAKQRLFTKSEKRRGQHTEKKITVESRPYSASYSGNSPYTQKLTSPGPKRKGSAKKAKSTF